MINRNSINKPDLTALYQLIDERNDFEQAKRIKHFAELYYAGAPAEDMQGRNVEDLYGATVSCWLFIQKNNIAEAKIRVFNPDFEGHGWQSTHTVIEILAKEMPFLISKSSSPSLAGILMTTSLAIEASATFALLLSPIARRFLLASSTRIL